MKSSVYPIDSFGLPGTIENDGSIGGGDSAAILGTILTLGDDKLIEAFKDKLPLIVKDGIPVRTPQDAPQGRTNRFSRDQLVPIICAGIRLGRNETVDKIFEAHKKRLFLFAWNTEANGDGAKFHVPDITLFQVWALWIRYMKPAWAKYVLWALDVENLWGAYQWKYLAPKKDRVTRNHMLVALTCNEVMPSVTSMMAHRVTPYEDLVNRWEAHCIDVDEYQTADLFRDILRRI